MHLSRACLLAVSLFLLQGAAWAQDVRPAFPGDRYLAPLMASEHETAQWLPVLMNGPRAPATDDAIKKRRSAIEMLGTQRSFAGDTDGAIRVFDAVLDIAYSRAVRPLEGAPDGVEAEDAIRAIVEQARTRRVVLINEAHHVPMNRAFTQKLAAALRKIGYSYLACETFHWQTTPAGKVAPLHADVNSGFYLREPSFGAMVNAALADGWTLVPYEEELVRIPGQDPFEFMQAREEAQARNLVERIFAKDKNAKVLIHVGYGHLQKSPGDAKGQLMMMGERLHRMTGLDMLHVDQTAFFAHPDRNSEARAYAALVDKFPVTEPFVLRAADGSHPVLLGMQAHVDMQVIFPRYASHDGRPDWLRTLAGRSPRAVPAELLPAKGRRLVKAYRVDDKADAVPADIVLVEAGKPAPALMLPAGEFRYAVEDEGS